MIASEQSSQPFNAPSPFQEFLMLILLFLAVACGFHNKLTHLVVIMMLPFGISKGDECFEEAFVHFISRE